MNGITNVCRTEGVPDFGNRRLVVFELTQIKQDKFLSDLVIAPDLRRDS